MVKVLRYAYILFLFDLDAPPKAYKVLLAVLKVQAEQLAVVLIQTKRADRACRQLDNQ